ncbi:MAG: PD-(D/E)XK nuclease family protein, partial [Verrucomicrobia bacterium]|nr:PD-(D/E)XK nuclease family protein [Verrucomicrobiota bacterium]
RGLELTNVFYVAMTRARDLVVLSGAGTKEPKGWLKLSEAFLSGSSPEVLRKLSFAEMPEIRSLESGVRAQELDVSFVPLEAPSGVERRTVTSLIENLKTDTCCLTPANDRRSFGSLGHSVLEQLAKNGWSGDIPELVEQSGAIAESERLIRQLEAAREVLRREAAGSTALFAEHPFVLKRGDMILDGTIDLLAQFSNGWKIFDYKFTNESPEAVLETYAPQLAAYKEAVQKLHHGTTVSAVLVLIGESVKLVPAV